MVYLGIPIYYKSQHFNDTSNLIEDMLANKVLVGDLADQVSAVDSAVF